MELLYLADLREKWHERESHEPAITGNNRLDIHGSSLGEYGDHWLLGRRKVAYNRHHARDERPLSGVRNIGILAIKKSHFRRLHDVGSSVALRSLNQKIRFDIAQNCKAEIGSRRGRIGQAW